MLQAQLVSLGRIELKEVPEPEPGDDEIVIKVETALTCGTDLKAYLRGHSLIPMPGPFGHEYSGVVIKRGSRVKNFKEGDEVMGVHSAPCLDCSYCKRGIYNLCENIMERKVLGAYGEQLLIPSPVVRQNLFKKPEHIGFERAALLEPLACVVHPYSQLDMTGVETALIIGAGPIGLLHASYLKSLGVHTIIADINPERLEIARGFAHRAVKPEIIQEVKEEQTSGMGFDLVVECTGIVDVWQHAETYLRRGGVLMLFGGCKRGSRVCYSTDRLHYDEIKLVGSFHFSPSDVKRSYELLINEELELDGIITGEFSLDSITEAFELLKAGRGIKYAIRP